VLIGSRPFGSREVKNVLASPCQEATRTAHLVPVILVGSSTAETDLIVLAVLAEPGPCKPMRAASSENTLQKAHWHSSPEDP
jgi:hypothetical protein